MRSYENALGFIFIALFSVFLATCGGSGGGGGTSAQSQLGDLKGTYIVISRSSETITSRGYPGDSGEAAQQNGADERVIFFGAYNSKDMFIRMNFSRTVSEGFELKFDNGFTIGESNPIQLVNTSFPIDGFPAPSGERPALKIGDLFFANNQADMNFATETKRWSLTLEKKTSEVPTAAQFADSSLLYSFMKTYNINPSSWPEDSAANPSHTHSCSGWWHGTGVSWTQVCFNFYNLSSVGATWDYSITGPGGYSKATTNTPTLSFHCARSEIYSCGTYTWSSTLRYGSFSQSLTGDFEVTSGEQDCGSRQ